MLNPFNPPLSIHYESRAAVPYYRLGLLAMNTLLRILPLLVIGLITTGLYGCQASDASGAAPDFILSTPKGDHVSLSSRKGRFVVLNFWATWCDSCKEELPALRELHAGAPAGGYELLAVSVDEDPKAVVPAFAKSNGMAFPILYADRRTLDDYAVRALPTTFLIGPDGLILRRYVGSLDSHTIQNDILSQLKRRLL